MAKRPEPFRVKVSDHLTGRLMAMAAASDLLTARLARLDATWEPIDWSEFD